MADIQLLIGCPMAVILPIIGFVSACVLVRYKKEYKECLVQEFLAQATSDTPVDEMAHTM